MHETNTFSRVKTDMALIRRRDFHLENEIPQAFRGTRSALGGHVSNLLLLRVEPDLLIWVGGIVRVTGPNRKIAVEPNSSGFCGRRPGSLNTAGSLRRGPAKATPFARQGIRIRRAAPSSAPRSRGDRCLPHQR